MSEMTWEQAAAEIERMNAERQAADEARRTAITPHVRRAPAKKIPQMSGSRYFNLMREMDRDPSAYADFRPTTYCGAPLTEVDWDKRGATAKKNAAEVARAGVCPECLRLARA